MQQTPHSSPTSSTGSLTRKFKGRTWFWKLKLCTSCVQPLGRIPFSNSAGAKCPQCGLSVCKNCRHYLDGSLTFGDHQYQHNWVCILCRASPNNQYNYTGPKTGGGKSIRRSWTISNPQRGQQNSPILKSYTIYNEDNSVRQSNITNHRQFNSLPRLNYGHASVQDENQPAMTSNSSTADEKINYSSSTLYPFRNHKSNSNSSVNFIEDVYWDYFGTSVFAPDSARSSCERSLGETECCSYIIETDRYPNSSQNQNNSTTITNDKNISISGSINHNIKSDSNNSNSSQKGKCTTIPIKPERANKRSNSLNSYDFNSYEIRKPTSISTKVKDQRSMTSEKLFSPLKTYVVLRQPTSTKKRSSSFNLDYCAGKRNRANSNSTTEYEDYCERLDKIKSFYSDSQKRPLSEQTNNAQHPVNINNKSTTTNTNRKGFDLIRDIREPLMKLKRSESANSSSPTVNYNLHRYDQGEDKNINSSTFLYGTLPKRKSKQSQWDNSYSSLDRRHYNIEIEREHCQENPNKIFSYTSTDKSPSHNNTSNNNNNNHFSSLPFVLSNQQSPQLKQAKYFHREDTNNIKSSASPVFNRSPISSSSSSSSSPIPKPPRKSLNRGQPQHQMSTLPKSFSYGMRNTEKVDPNLEILLRKSERILNPGGQSSDEVKSPRGQVSNQTFPRRKPLIATNLCSSLFEPSNDVQSSSSTSHGEYSRNILKVNSNNNNNKDESDEDVNVSVSKLNHDDGNEKDMKKQKTKKEERKVIKGNGQNDDEDTARDHHPTNHPSIQQVFSSNSVKSREDRRYDINNINIGNKNENRPKIKNELTDLNSQYAHYDTRVSKNHVSTQPLSFIDSNNKSQQQQTQEQQEQNNSKPRNEFVTTVQINNDMCYYEPNLNPILRIYQPTISKTQDESNATILQNRYPNISHINNNYNNEGQSLLKSIPFKIPIEIEKDINNISITTTTTNSSKKVPLTTSTSLSPSTALSTKYNNTNKDKNSFTSLSSDTNIINSITNVNNDNSCDNNNTELTSTTKIPTTSDINQIEQSNEDNFDSASSVSKTTDNSSDDTIIDCSQLKQSFTTTNNYVNKIYTQGSNVNVDSVADSSSSSPTDDLINVNVGGEENSINIHEPKHNNENNDEHENINTSEYELKKEHLVETTKQQTIPLPNLTTCTKLRQDIKSETDITNENHQELPSIISSTSSNNIKKIESSNHNLTDKIKKLVFGQEESGQEYNLDQILQLQRDITSLEKDNENSSQPILPSSSSSTSKNIICQENDEQQTQLQQESVSNTDDCKSEDGILQELAPNLQDPQPLLYQNSNTNSNSSHNFDITSEFQRFCDISQKSNLLEIIHVFETERQHLTIDDKKNVIAKGGKETEEEKGIQDIIQYIEDDDDDNCQIHEQNYMNHCPSTSNSSNPVQIEEIFDYSSKNNTNNYNNNSTSNSLPYDIEYHQDITDNDNTILKSEDGISNLQDPHPLPYCTRMDHERFERLTPEGEESFTEENTTTKQVQRTSPDGEQSPPPNDDDDKMNKLVDEESFQVTSSDSDNSWIEEIPYEEEGFPPLDLTLHTIVEESCEDSCDDEAECMSLKEQLVNRRPIDDLENYFNYLDPANVAANSSSDPLNLSHYDYHSSPQQQHRQQQQQQYLAHEDSEFSDTFSESSFNSEIHQNHEDENSMLELENNAVDLASTRLEKYFTNLNYGNTNSRSSGARNSEQTGGGGGGYPEDSEDSVGSESENDDHFQDKRKKVLKHKRTAKECDGDDESIIFDQDEGHFDTIKKSSKKKSDMNAASNCDVEQEPSESNFMYHSYDDERSLEMTANNNDNSSGSIKFSASTNQDQSSSAAATPTTVPKSKQVNRSNSFQWSSDEEVNQMMSKLRHLIKNLMQKNPHTTSAEPSTLNSQSQLRYFETELIRLMRQEPQLKNIVSEYISSEESDDNINEFNQFIKEVVNQEQFDSRYASSSSSSSSFKNSTDSPLLQHKLQQPQSSLGQSNSPALIAKVMHHIGNRLSVWMKDEEEEREGTLKQVSSVSSDLNEDRFSWKGSFESTLAAKRQSVGSTDSISSSDFNNPHNSQNTLGVDRILRSSSLHHLANSQPIEEKKEEEDNISNISNSLPRLNVANMSRAQSLMGIKEKVKSARYRPPGFQQAPSIIKQIDEKMSVSTPSLHHDHSPDTPINLRSSADSISSMLEHGVGRINVRGSIEFGLGYNYKLASLEVRVKQCRDLASVDTKRNRSDPYVKVYLLPDRSKSGKRKTKTKKNTLNPIFEETLKFPVTISELQKRILWISVWHSDIFGKNEFLGQVLLNLKDRVFDDTSPSWYSLEQYSGSSGMSEDQEVSREDLQLIIALKWQPQNTTRNQSTGTLSVLIKEAKNLMPTKNGASAPSTFVKVCPIKESKTSHRSKHKTSVARRTVHPVWNTTLILEDVILEDGVEISIWNVYDLLSNSHLLSSMKLDSDVPLWEAMCNRPNFWIEGQLQLQVL